MPPFIEEPCYPSRVYDILDDVLCWLTRLGSLRLDYLLSCFIWTTEEMKTPWRKVLTVPVLIPIYLSMYIALFPLTLTTFLLWVSFQHKRKPYRYAKQPKVSKKPTPKDQYTFATANLCLLPEFLSRFNNSSDNYVRAREVTRRIVEQQQRVSSSSSSFPSSSPSSPSVSPPSPKSRPLLNGDIPRGPSIDHAILEEFPALDVLIVQEAWIPRCCREMIRELITVFPHVVYDVGVTSWESNRWLGNSGLMIASKYPVLDVNFNWFKDKCFADLYSSKGLLQIKLDLGLTKSGQQLVGYVANTHLQAYQGTLPIHSQQMDNIVEWTEQFRKTSLYGDEKVVFDVVAGDFNTDNVSPVDEPEWNHKLFQVYEDICRERPGKDYPWVVGTEMRHRPLHDRRISTPSLLRTALQDPELLQYYILDGNMVAMVLDEAFRMPDRDAHGNIVLIPEVGGKRRIDYIIHRRTDNNVVLACNPVTSLAKLTDHIPYTLRIKVPAEKLV